MRCQRAAENAFPQPYATMVKRSGADAETAHRTVAAAMAGVGIGTRLTDAVQASPGAQTFSVRRFTLRLDTATARRCGRQATSSSVAAVFTENWRQRKKNIRIKSRAPFYYQHKSWGNGERKRILRPDLASFYLVIIIGQYLVLHFFAVSARIIMLFLIKNIYSYFYATRRSQWSARRPLGGRRFVDELIDTAGLLSCSRSFRHRLRTRQFFELPIAARLLSCSYFERFPDVDAIQKEAMSLDVRKLVFHIVDLVL